MHTLIILPFSVFTMLYLFNKFFSLFFLLSYMQCPGHPRYIVCGRNSVAVAFEEGQGGNAMGVCLSLFDLICTAIWGFGYIATKICILKNGPTFPMFICGVSIPNQMKYQINVLNLSIYFFLHLVTSESIFERQCSTLHILLKGYTYIYTYIKRKTWKISVKHCILRSFK